MWLWRPRRPKGKELFFIELLGLSSALHVFVALIFFLASAGHYQTFSLTVHHDARKKKIPVMFLSGRKGRSASCSGRSALQANNNARGKAKNNSCNHVRSKTKKAAPVVAKKKKAVPVLKTATTLDDKKQPQKDAKKEKDTKEKREKPKEEIKQKEKKVEPEQPKEELLKKEEEIKESVQQEEQAPIVEEAAVADENPEAFEYVMGAQEALGDEYEAMPYEQARIFMVLQEELREQWMPPQGLSKDLVCTIVASVDRAGRVGNVHVKDTSGVLVYDISARQAMQKITLPPYAWGREYSVAFRQ